MAKTKLVKRDDLKITCVADAFQYLSAGYIIATENMRDKARFDENGNFIQYMTDNTITGYTVPGVGASFAKIWCEVYEEVEIKWYDNIPNHGIMCKVWDNDAPTEVYEPALVIGYVYNTLFKIYNATQNSISYWDNAEPLTKEELLKYCYEELHQ